MSDRSPAKVQDDILSYREMCDAESVQTLQRGMNFRMNPAYSVILMSQRSNAPYHDRVHIDGVTIEYEGHDVSKRTGVSSYNPKTKDQPERTINGTLTQNGHFLNAVAEYKEGRGKPELVKVYEKILPGVWSLKGYFNLIDAKTVHDGNRNVYRYVLKLTDFASGIKSEEVELSHTRLIPSEVKKEVWKRDEGKCVQCGSRINLHFDHDLPFSRGGTSLSISNVKLLCMKHNLQKSDKIQ